MSHPSERYGLAAMNGFGYAIGVCGLVVFLAVYTNSAMYTPAPDFLSRATNKWTESPIPAAVLSANWFWWAGCFYLTASLVANPRTARRHTFGHLLTASLLATAVVLLALAFCVVFV